MNYIIKKTTPNDVLFRLHPIDNPQLTKLIYLNSHQKQQSLPENWALGVFFDEQVYNMYKKGLFTFNDNDGITKAAFENGVYFDDKLDFTPAKDEDLDAILAILKTGKRSEIVSACDKYGAAKVKDVAIVNCNDLTTAVVSMLEQLWNIQLTMNSN